MTLCYETVFTSPVSLGQTAHVSYSVLHLHGRDTRDFLQRVLTQDVMHLGARVAHAGYCDPKGRLFGTMRLWLTGEDGVMMLIPADNADMLAKRLRMFVLRDDVKVDDVTTQYDITAILGNLDAQLSDFDLPRPAAGEAMVSEDGRRHVLMIESVPPVPGVCTAAARALVLLPKGECAALEGTEAAFWFTEAAAGIPSVWTATNGKFVPQQINLDAIDGVSFTKGCYPGQEVVSRMKHIGRPSRRMFLVRSTSGSTPHPGDTVYSEGAEAGFVVHGATVAGTTLVLVSVLISAAEKGLSLSAEGEALEVLPLPYNPE